MWAGILGHHIVGSSFLEENVNGQVYFDMLDTLIHTYIIVIMEQENEHYAAHVRQFFDDNF